MRIQAYVPVYQESDILPHTLRHLHEQGCAVHVIDGWSTDGSWDGAMAAWHRGEAVTAERFPADGPDPIQNCTAILKRIEDLAAQSDADWILYTDADEWRRAPSQLWSPSSKAYSQPRLGLTLSEVINLVDAQGFSAIDFRVFQYYCTHNVQIAEWTSA